MPVQCEECGAIEIFTNDSERRCRACNRVLRAAPRAEPSLWSGLDSLVGIIPTHVLATAGASPRGPSTRAPASEGSGLIDIRAMQTLVGGRSAGESKQASAPVDEPIPSFGGGFGDLSASPLLPPKPVSAAPAPSPSGSNKMLFAIASALGAAILGLGAFMLMHPPASPEPDRAVVATAPAVVDEQPAESEQVEQVEKVEKVEEPSAAVEPTAFEPEPAATEPKPPKPRSRNRTPKQPSTTSPVTQPVVTSEPKPSGDPIDVDCLIDKSLTKCKGKKPSDSNPEPTDPKPKPAEELPNKLTSGQISTGLAPVKTAAKSCGSGTTVEIKFSVAGATGQVVSATPLGEHASTSVGQCVAKAAKAASFPKFAAGQQGFSFKFRL